MQMLAEPVSYAAAARYGLVTIERLLAEGLTRSAVAKRVRRGVLRRWYPGVYSYGPGLLSREASWMAAVLAGGPGTVLSHLSAAVLWRAWRHWRRIADVLAPRGRRPTGPVLVRNYRQLDAADVTVIDGIPVTTMSRTLVDLADVLTPHALANVIHEADFRGLFDLPETRASMRRAAGRRNLRVLDRAIGLHAAGSAGTRSGKEDKLLALLQLARLPEPLVNTRHLGVELDCYWPLLALNVEVDGGGHERPRTRREDAARDERLQAAGITVLRIGTDDIERQPTGVLERLSPWFREGWSG